MRKRLSWWMICLLILFPILLGLSALCIGRISISPGDAWKAILSRITGDSLVDKSTILVIWNSRVPRILMAALVGAGLSVSGLAFQSLFANPLATPDTLGIASGSSFGAALGILLGFGLAGVQIISFVFGIIAVAITAFIGKGKGRGMGSMVLGGIMVGSLFSAFLSFIKYAADKDSVLPAITYWMMGSLQTAGYEGVAFGAPSIIIGITVLFIIRWRMNLLPLTEEEIQSSGVRVGWLRGVVAVCATMMTAAAVAMCGQVGWVGLLIPHIARMIFGADHRLLVPVSVSMGASFLIVVDTISRSLFASELPVSIVTAIIGAPFFIFLLRKNRRWAMG